MKDGKPEVVAFLHQPDFYEPHVSLKRYSSCQCVHPLIRLSDHEAVVADLHKSIQRMIDQTTPLVPDPNDPKWSRRIQIDDLMAQVAELKSLLCTARDYVYSELETRKQALAGYPHKWQAEQSDLDAIDAALSK